ncbi:MAG: metal-dependent transcriptional regulator [Candidatus Bathyarchaeia archaeon]
MSITNSAKAAEKSECEVMYTAAAPAEHVEEYLEAIWLIEEAGESPAKVASVAKRLNVSPPSAVQMLKRLEKDAYMDYKVRKGVVLKPRGREIGRKMVRNGRLIEVLMKKVFDIKIDPRIACGIEHHMTEEFADALCTMLKHPPHCPHGKEIPRGQCCPETPQSRTQKRPT